MPEICVFTTQINLASFLLYKYKDIGAKAPTMMPTDCSVLCTPTIFPIIRISWDCHPTFRLILGWGQTLTNYIYNNIKIAYEICKTWIFNTKKRARSISLIGMFCITEAGVMLLLLVLLFENYFSKIINQFLTTAQ